MISADTDQILIVMIDTFIVTDGRFRVYLCVVWIDGNPWDRVGESGIRGGIPLHWCPGVVTPFGVDRFHNVFRILVKYRDSLGIMVERVDVLVLADGAEPDVGHTQLLALVDIRSSLERMKEGSQHLGAFHAVFSVVPKAAYHSCLIMVI